ncbi:MAG: hypothetical protein R3324_15815, partial [Halobacteriales archaeon]|nr:hypothetical protein [Halobacteriales archaeon]
MVDKYRTVVESDRYRKEREALSKDVQRWDEMIAGLLVALCRSPESGHPTDDPRVWAIASVPWPGTADVVLYYTFDEEE